MGKNLIQQRRGRGTSTFRSPSFRFKGDPKHHPFSHSTVIGKVTDLMSCQGHSGPLMEVQYAEKKVLSIAPEGIRVGDNIATGNDVEAKIGNTTQLKNLPEGSSVYNIEAQPGDGGKFVRSSGAYARLVGKYEDKIVLLLPSNKTRAFRPDCRATIGIVAGSGRIEKPILKAGNMWHKKNARNRLYPRVSALAMNAVDHPFGGSRTSKKGKVTIARRNAPAGAKVGLIRPRRTGRR